MSFYDRYVLPHLVHLACKSRTIQHQRRKIVPRAHGRVLEIGMGSGLNIPFYQPSRVEWVWGLEPSPEMRRKARSHLQAAEIEVRWLDFPGEEIPLEDHTVDTVVVTYTLCTIPDWQTALGQMRRVIKPGGALLFCEHGQAPDPAVQRWQQRINPVWKSIAGGCHLIRPIPGLLEQGGFRVSDVDTMYLPGSPRFASFNYWGRAVPA